MVAFKNSIADSEITLLMPDPTSREIRRHMQERADAAVATLETAARKAPFLWKLPNWPLTNKTTHLLAYELRQIADQQFEAFLDLFDLVELDYEGVAINEIMNWYDAKIAPFSEKKKSEFPDAFAIAALERHRDASDESVAVISKDPDFKKACERFPGLMYFPSLVAYSEALQSADERLASIQAALESNSESIRNAINGAFEDSGFTIEANWDGEASDVEIVSIDQLAFHVVGIGEDHCTVAFEGEIEYSAYVSYDDLESATYEKGEPIVIHHRIEGTTEEAADISGVLMIRIKDKGQTIEGIDSATLDQRDFTIGEEPFDF